mmetsp:Transcript_30101/g.48274  ORF Transcript_30101/g.48274 Transcript_30101/m.48274 type:complete len:422 (-) Transcript_30101:177-1442(-)
MLGSEVLALHGHSQAPEPVVHVGHALVELQKVPADQARAASVEALPPGIAKVSVQLCRALLCHQSLLHQVVHLDRLVATHVVLHDARPELALLPGKLNGRLLRVRKATLDVALNRRADGEQREHVADDGAHERADVPSADVQVGDACAVDVHVVGVHKGSGVAHLEGQSKHARAGVEVENEEDGAEHEEVHHGESPGAVVDISDAIGVAAVHEHDVQSWQHHAVEVVPASRHGAAQGLAHRKHDDEGHPLHAEAILVDPAQARGEVGQGQEGAQESLAEGDRSKASMILAHPLEGHPDHEAVREAGLHFLVPRKGHMIQPPGGGYMGHETASNDSEDEGEQNEGHHQPKVPGKSQDVAARLKLLRRLVSLLLPLSHGFGRSARGGLLFNGLGPHTMHLSTVSDNLFLQEARHITVFRIFGI